jgi:hypothetical protein
VVLALGYSKRRGTTLVYEIDTVLPVSPMAESIDLSRVPVAAEKMQTEVLERVFIRGLGIACHDVRLGPVLQREGSHPRATKSEVHGQLA